MESKSKHWDVALSCQKCYFCVDPLFKDILLEILVVVPYVIGTEHWPTTLLSILSVCK